MNLIDVDVLKNTPVIIQLSNNCCTETASNLIECFQKVVRAQTIIEAEPVIHARWINKGITPISERDVWECSNCGSEYRLDKGSNPKKYCGDCGAKMDIKKQTKKRLIKPVT